MKPIQYVIIKYRPCLTNLMFFYDQVTHLVYEGRAIHIVYLDFNKAFNSVSHSILLESLQPVSWMDTVFAG